VCELGRGNSQCADAKKMTTMMVDLFLYFELAHEDSWISGDCGIRTRAGFRSDRRAQRAEGGAEFG
jgi:hypothetical protein